MTVSNGVYLQEGDVLTLTGLSQANSFLAMTWLIQKNSFLAMTCLFRRMVSLF